MWCPECKAEYVSGITECPECKVQLVNRLPEPSPPLAKKIDYVELLRTESLSEIAFIKSLLESAGITYYFKGGQFTHSRFGTHAALLMVDRDQIDEARALLGEFIRDR